MGQNKGLAQRIFSSRNFGSVTIDLAIENLTSATGLFKELPKAASEKDFRQSLSIGVSKEVELLEFQEHQIVLGSIIQFAALGHHVRIDLAVFPDQKKEKATFRFSSKGEVTFAEKKIQDGKVIFIFHIRPQKGDHVNWKQLYDFYSTKQEETDKLLEKMKGTE